MKLDRRSVNGRNVSILKEISEASFRRSHVVDASSLLLSLRFAISSVTLTLERDKFNSEID